jgi:rRNA-processing protein FCF1
MISDIEAKRGDIQATVLELDDLSIAKGRELLLKYADRYNCGSHDALIVGSLIVARQVRGTDLTLVTSDKGLQAVLKDEAIPFYDPASQSQP